MYPARRNRLITLGAIATFLLFLFYRSSTNEIDSRLAKDFYDKTLKAMDDTRRAGQAAWSHASPYDPNERYTKDRDGDGDVDEADVKSQQELGERLRDAEKLAKDKANEKAGRRPDPPSKVVGVGSSQDGQEKTGRTGGTSKQAAAAAAAAAVAAAVQEELPLAKSEKAKKQKTSKKMIVEDEVYKARKESAKKSEALAGEDEDDEEAVDSVKSSSKEDQESLAATDAVKAEKLLKRVILTKAPVVIFSKSYCPYSKRAKKLLLEKYSIRPEPYVVELDELALGSQLQDALEKMTGRRTVPNILVNGYSLGGSDEITTLDEADKLVGSILKHGDKKVTIAERVVATVDKDPLKDGEEDVSFF